MESESLYVTAPSNASIKKYPSNTGGEYKFDLPQTLHLSPEWEVGLSEITYRQDWDNIHKENIWIRYEDKTLPENDVKIIKRIDNFKSQWKELINSLGPLQFQVRRNDDLSRKGKLYTLDWIKADEPLPIKEFAEKLNDSLAKACEASGWSKEYCPFIEAPWVKADSFFPQEKEIKF